MIERLISLVIGYFIGCIQSAYIRGKLSGIDIRDHGSKNAGMTNVTRVLGRKAGIIVFIADVLKAMIAFVIASLIFSGGGTFLGSGWLIPGLWAGAGVILGHDFPFFLKFRGGKGISSTLGLLIMLDWRVFLIAGILALIMIFVFKYISLASLIITASAPILMLIMGHSIEVIIITALLAVLAWYLHRANITRLLSGAENKFSLKKK